MKLAIHPQIKGKWKKDSTEKFPFNGWTNIDATIEDIFDLITVDGYASSSELTGDVRGCSNFQSRQLFMVDIDDGMTIIDLFEHSCYETFGCGFYTTPSHTLDHHKFRILFQTETPITNAKDATDLMRALNRIFNGDPVCKDVTRLFYGTPDCEFKELKPTKYLHDYAVALILEDIRSDDAVELAEVTKSDVVYSESTDEEKAHIVDLLSNLNLRYSGMYETWRNLGWGLKAGGYSRADYLHITASATGSKTSAEASKIWDSSSGGITMGSVIHLLRQSHSDKEIFLKKAVIEETDNLSWAVTKTSNNLAKMKKKLIEMRSM